MPVPIKITYLIPALHWGGAEGQLLTLIRRLDRGKFLPKLMLFEPPTSQQVPADLDADVESLGIGGGQNSEWSRKLFSLAGATARLAGQLRRDRPHILHTFLPGASILGVAAARLALPAPAVIYSRRSLSSAYRRSRVLALADRKAMLSSDLAIGNSAAVAVDLHDDGMPPDRTITIHNGVDTDRFHAEIPATLRDSLGWGAEQSVFAYVANFHPTKCHEDFLLFAQRIFTRLPHCRFLLGGRDRGELAKVQAMVVSLRLEKVTHIVVDSREPETVFAAADVCISSSESEGLSNVLLEAMACGKPIIATDVGGNREVVVEGTTGFLVPAHDPAAMAEKAEALLRDPALRWKMSRAGRERAVQNFSIAAMVARYQQVYEDLVAQRQSPL